MSAIVPDNSRKLIAAATSVPELMYSYGSSIGISATPTQLVAATTEDAYLTAVSFTNMGNNSGSGLAYASFKIGASGAETSLITMPFMVWGSSPTSTMAPVHMMSLAIPIFIPVGSRLSVAVTGQTNSSAGASTFYLIKKSALLTQI